MMARDSSTASASNDKEELSLSVSDAASLRTAIENAMKLRDTYQRENAALQRRVAGIFQKTQETNPAGGNEPRNKAKEQKNNANENEKRYLECLRGIHDAKKQTAAARGSYDKLALDLQARLDEKEAKVTEIQDAFLQFKREVAKNAENTRTGKPIPAKVVLQFENAEVKKDQDVERVRLKNINLRMNLKKLEQSLKAKEQLAEGLHLIDFEQLKIENQTLNEKIEERNEELHKLRKKTTGTVQVVTHIKEKLQFVLAENQTLKRELAALEESLTGHRDQLAKCKKTHECQRKALHRYQNKEGLASSDRLIEDYEKRDEELLEVERRLLELKQLHAHLTRSLRKIPTTS